MLIAALIRLTGLCHFDLWLDEVWSILQVAKLSSWHEIVTKLHHDNNHILTSWWLYILGPGEAPIAYRAFSLASSLLAIFVAATLSPPLAVLMAFSFPLVLYGTEARGYSPLILAVVATVVTLEKTSGNRRSRFLFLTSTFGMLAHSSYLMVLPGVLAYLAVDRRSGSTLLSRIAQQLYWFIPWLCFFAALYLTHLQYLDIGGGPRGSLVEVWLNSVGTIFGIQEISEFQLEKSAITLVIAVSMLVATVVEAFLLLRSNRPLGALIFVCAIVVPALIVFVLEPDFLLPRYFLASNLFLLIAAAYFGNRLWNAGIVGKGVAAGMAGFFIYSNSLEIGGLYRYGRGDPARGLFLVEKLTRGQPNQTFTSTSDFRTTVVLEYYSKLSPRIAALRYIPGNPSSENIAIVEELDRYKPVAATFEGRELVEVFPAAPLSGLPWRIYKKSSKPEAAE